MDRLDGGSHQELSGRSSVLMMVGLLGRETAVARVTTMVVALENQEGPSPGLSVVVLAGV